MNKKTKHNQWSSYIGQWGCSLWKLISSLFQKQDHTPKQPHDSLPIDLYPSWAYAHTQAGYTFLDSQQNLNYKACRFMKNQAELYIKLAKIKPAHQGLLSKECLRDIDTFPIFINNQLFNPQTLTQSNNNNQPISNEKLAQQFIAKLHSLRCSFLTILTISALTHQGLADVFTGGSLAGIINIGYPFSLIGGQISTHIHQKAPDVFTLGVAISINHADKVARFYDPSTGRCLFADAKKSKHNSDQPGAHDNFWFFPAAILQPKMKRRNGKNSFFEKFFGKNLN